MRIKKGELFIKTQCIFWYEWYHSDSAYGWQIHKLTSSLAFSSRTSGGSSLDLLSTVSLDTARPSCPTVSDCAPDCSSIPCQDCSVSDWLALIGWCSCKQKDNSMQCGLRCAVLITKCHWNTWYILFTLTSTPYYCHMHTCGLRRSLRTRDLSTIRQTNGDEISY